jgi:hypothetical protein
VIAREKQREHLVSGAITDGETDAKNASVDGPLGPFQLRPFLARKPRWIRFSVRDCADLYRADVAAQSQPGKLTQKHPLKQPL